jgi:hypothetical protein
LLREQNNPAIKAEQISDFVSSSHQQHSNNLADSHSRLLFRLMKLEDLFFSGLGTRELLL